MNLSMIASFIESQTMSITTLTLSITTFILQEKKKKNYQQKYHNEESFETTSLEKINYEEPSENRYSKTFSLENQETLENTKQKVLTLKRKKRF